MTRKTILAFLAATMACPATAQVAAPDNAAFAPVSLAEWAPGAGLDRVAPLVAPDILWNLRQAAAPCALRIGTHFRFDELDSALAAPEPLPGGLAIAGDVSPAIPSSGVSAFGHRRTATGRTLLTRAGFDCRPGRAVPDERVVTLARGGASQCYFAAMPQLRLDDSGADRGFPPRVILTVRSRENVQAELELMLTRAPDGDGWSEPGVAFSFAAPGLRTLGVEEADIRLDSAAVPADLALVMFGDTRLRVMMDPYRNAGKAPDAFFSRLASSERATLRLLDAGNRSLAVLRFDVGPALETARMMLARTNWSCGRTAQPAQFAMR